MRAIIDKSGLSDQDFAASIGVSKAHLSNILRGFRKPGREAVKQLQEVYGVNPGDLFGPGLTAETAYIELIEQEAAAGHGMEIEDYPAKTHIAVPQSLIAPHKADYIKAVIVRGESMIDEKIFDGDYVLYNQYEREGENIFVVAVGTTLLVKRVAFDSLHEEIRLISANHAAAYAYPDRVFRGADCEEVRIAGKVIACMHRVAP
jgi:SOS-response transcriptional repressor LexA